MIIRAYGLFWRADEITWNPGKGRAGEFRLLGRRGVNLPGRRVADFRQQRGLYILYGDYRPYYVGLTRKQDLGKRLKDHLADTTRTGGTGSPGSAFVRSLSRRIQAVSAR